MGLPSPFHLLSLLAGLGSSPGGLVFTFSTGVLVPSLDIDLSTSKCPMLHTRGIIFHPFKVPVGGASAREREVSDQERSPRLPSFTP